MEQTATTNQWSTLEWARHYVEKRFFVIPLDKDSALPLEGCEEYKKKKPGDEKLREWFDNGSQNNIGIVTGEVSGIVVLDINSNKEEAEQFTQEHISSQMPKVKTEKGIHIYFHYDKELQEFHNNGILPDGIDLKSDGTHVMAPPSGHHPSGHQYAWDENSSLDVPFGELGQILLQEQRFKEMIKEQVKITFQKIQYHKQLFHDQYNDTFIFYNGEAISLQSKKFKTLLYHRQCEKEGELLSINKINQEIHILEAEALYRRPQKVLHNRVAKKDDFFWYDMGDGSAIKVSEGKWELVGAPILFRRYTHQQKQVRPEQAKPQKGGDPWAVFDFISNVPDEQRLLVLVYIISCFIPDIAHPVFYPYGPQGAGKSTLCRIIKSLCDPSEAGLLAAPEGKEDLVQNLAHHYVCIFDNVSRLSEYMSDTIARACTGAGFSKRKRYTDDEDIIYKIKHCVGLNGINQIIHKPDLMERTILLHLDRIEPSKRKDEEEFWSSFQEQKPDILGGIFDTLAEAMLRHPQAKKKIDKLPRLADFAQWGYAISEALGKKGEEFIKLYESNIQQQNQEVLHENALMQAVYNLIKEQEDNQKDTWSGKVQPAYNKLRKLAGDIATSDTTFPRSSNKLRGALKSIEVNLRTFGITYEIGDHKHDGTDITFKKASEKSSDNKNNNHGCIPFVLIESSLDFEYIQELYFSPEYTAEDKLMPFHNTRL